MSISALSSSAPLSTPNNFKYNGKEEQTDFDLNWYDYGARNYDAQIGRFIHVDPMADLRVGLTPYNYVQNNPMLRIDPTGALDDYYDVEGNYLGSDGEGDNLRLVREGQEAEVSSKLNGEKTTTEDRSAARSSENSAIIEIDASVQTVVQDMADHSLYDGREHSALLLLDIYSDTPTITAVEQETGTNDESELNSVEDGNRRYDKGTGFLIIGQVHGHPKTDDKGKVNESGTSTKDQNTAVSTGIPIYAVNAYSGKLGSNQSVHRANPNPTNRRSRQTRNVGKSGSFNIARDAIEIHGGKRRL